MSGVDLSDASHYVYVRFIEINALADHLLIEHYTCPLTLFYKN